jgi:hypothetical protein
MVRRMVGGPQRNGQENGREDDRGLVRRMVGGPQRNG